MEISVVIPTYNRLAQLRRVVAGLEHQSYPLERFEVVIVSDGSEDGTDEYLVTLITPLQIQVVRQPNSGAAAARNNGVHQARGKLVLFIDDDVVPAPTLLAEHLRSHEEAGPRTVVIGPLVTPADFAMQDWVRWEQDRLEEQYQDMVAGRWEPTARQFYTGNASLRRSDILAAGGFDPHFRRAEDVEFGYRLADAGFRFVFNPAAIGYHYAERTFGSWLKTPYAYGRNDVIFTRDRGQHWLLPLVEREFHNRNALVRGLVHLCLNRQRSGTLVVMVLQSLALLCVRIGCSRGASAAFGALFNLRYYQGAADELALRGDHLYLASTRKPAAGTPKQHNRI
ncbi:MAG: glycosyltransferase family 2 protein [Blastochloris sp.]|nr:glycosyltransferase family 2 protein [Blastochloris sp.]